MVEVALGNKLGKLELADGYTGKVSKRLGLCWLCGLLFLSFMDTFGCLVVINEDDDVLKSTNTRRVLWSRLVLQL